MKPRQIRLPLLFWLLLIASAGLLIWYQGIPYVPGEPRVVVVTPTPGPQVTPGPSPTPVGSGGTVAFSMRHNGNSDIYLFSQDDSQLLRLTYDPAEDRDPAWSPDGRWLAFASHRANNWDLYLMDINAGTVVRLTRDPAFETGPAWSPDSRWLAYESYEEGDLNIHVISVDGKQEYQLTHDPTPDFSPSWSPDGRHIAFTSLRDHNKDLYLVSLDGGDIINLTHTPDQDEDHAAWSRDGDYLAYSTGVPANEEIRVLPFDREAISAGEVRPMLFGTGGEPVWAPDNQALAFVFRQGTTSYLIAASSKGWALAQEGFSTTDWLEGPVWTDLSLPEEFAEQLKARMEEKEPALYTELLLEAESASGPYRFVGLPSINGGDGREKLSDKVNDSFNAMRQSIEDATGWDYLSILGDSSRSMNYTPRPGQGRISWHVCGRAIDINQGFLSKDLIELVREDIGGVTYWRVFIKAEKQDGSLGEPLTALPWDLNARSEGGLAAAQGGEYKDAVPEGYYVDFTTIAADYGWERRNALSNWRASWFDIEWWHFQKTEGMSWYQCMLEIYEEEEIADSYGSIPWWAKQPEWQVQAWHW